MSVIGEYGAREVERMTNDPNEFMPQTVARELAEQIADDLFCTSNGEVAERLELKITDWSDGVKVEFGAGGWCRRAVVDRIVAILHKNPIVGELQAFRILDAAGRIGRRTIRGG